jgi:predicted HTH transcriptional regulator
VTGGKSGERASQSGETGEKSGETGGQSEEAIAAWAESVLPTKLRTDARGNMVRILVAIGLDSKITTEGMCTRTGMSASGVAKVLSALKKMGVIFRDGPDYGGSWHLGDRKNNEPCCREGRAEGNAKTNGLFRKGRSCARPP